MVESLILIFICCVVVVIPYFELFDCEQLMDPSVSWKCFLTELYHGKVHIPFSSPVDNMKWFLLKLR